MAGLWAGTGEGFHRLCQLSHYKAVSGFQPGGLGWGACSGSLCFQPSERRPAEPPDLGSSRFPQIGKIFFKRFILEVGVGGGPAGEGESEADSPPSVDSDAPSEFRISIWIQAPSLGP